MRFSLNFIIHLIIAAELFAINNFNISHIIWLRVMLLLVECGAADCGWTNSLISMMRKRLTALAGRAVVVIAVL